MKRTMFLCGMLWVVQLLSCAPAGEVEAPIAEEAPSMEADIEAIKKVGEQELAAANAGDVDAFLAIIADDIEMMPPNQPAVKGEAARQWVAGFMAQVNLEIKPYADEEVEVDGDLAVHRYSFEWTATPKEGGDPIHEKGAGLHVLRRQPDGSWKIEKDIWTPDAPPSTGG